MILNRALKYSIPHHLRLDESASMVALQKASADQLRELASGLLCGSKRMKMTLDEYGLSADLAGPEASSSAKPSPSPLADRNMREESENFDAATFEKDLEKQLDNMPDERAPEAPGTPDYSQANSVTHRKLWMKFGRRLAVPDGPVKYPEICRLWEGSNAELWTV